MFLQRLYEYAERLDLPPVMYQKTFVQWLIDLDKRGNLKGFIPLAGDPGARRRGKEIFVPHIMRASGINPKLLADNGEYVLGLAREQSRQSRVEKSHQQFVNLVRKC